MNTGLFEWKNGTKTQNAVVTSDGVTVQDAVYEGETPLSASNLNKAQTTLLNLIYNAVFPIGQVIIKGDDKDYSDWLGFTWERTATGKVLVGYDSLDNDFNVIGKTGGEKKHTLTIEEMPAHTHTLVYFNNNKPINLNAGGSSYHVNFDQTGTNEEQVGGRSTGGDKPHNNLQPYQVVAYWKRIS